MSILKKRPKTDEELELEKTTYNNEFTKQIQIEIIDTNGK